jgi:hypothetical protein
MEYPDIDGVRQRTRAHVDVEGEGTWFDWLTAGAKKLWNPTRDGIERGLAGHRCADKCGDDSRCRSPLESSANVRSLYIRRLFCTFWEYLQNFIYVTRTTCQREKICSKAMYLASLTDYNRYRSVGLATARMQWALEQAR